MNALVGEKLSIITPKAQTTRHRIFGIVNGEDFQIVYSDLPGILTPGYKLQEKMLAFIENALSDADIFLYMVEIGETRYNEKIVKRINDSSIPVLTIINKIDLSSQEDVKNQIDYWQQIFPKSQVIPVSALKRFNIKTIIQSIRALLPVSPPFFDKETLTDKTMRFFIAEIIREKILLIYKQEIPYSVEVVVDSYKEEEDIIRISTLIFVARESQKKIIIGKEGKSIKRVGIEARKDMESFTGKKIFLETYVKVRKDWRDDDLQLKRFGYQV